MSDREKLIQIIYDHPELTDQIKAFLSFVEQKIHPDQMLSEYLG